MSDIRPKGKQSYDPNRDEGRRESNKYAANQDRIAAQKAAKKTQE